MWSPYYQTDIHGRSDQCSYKHFPIKK